MLHWSIQASNEEGYEIDTIIATGGGTKNPLFLREHADATGLKIVLPKEREAVLLGSAMLGAVAAGKYTSVEEAMEVMSGAGNVVRPTKGRIRTYHDAKYKVFQRLYDDQMAYRDVMNESTPNV